ncbi:hypothetical protein [Pseudomonas tohonis]|uniref:hypothetical protein n=1 Tax=Pseudomonas tohonis TaxID=2725477 RepID=UPI001F341E51|nr:hypothetical protein [Pseudomonas tohonis]
MSDLDYLWLEEFIVSSEIYDVQFAFDLVSGWSIKYNMNMNSIPVDMEEVFMVINGCDKSTTDKEFLEKLGCQDSNEKLVLFQKLRTKIMTDAVVEHIDGFQKLFKMIDIDLEYNGNYLSFYFADGRHLNVNVSSFEAGIIHDLGCIFFESEVFESPYEVLKKCRRWV